MNGSPKSKKNNEKENISFKFVVYEDELSNYEDSDGLEIDETPSPKRNRRKRKTPQLDGKEKAVLENIEEEIERQLDEKASSTNMTVKNVKNILKHIITNEQVLALVRHSVNDEPFKSENLTFEPKLTRAKVRELYKNQPTNISPKRTTSEIRILIDQELPEDEEDEEYVPGEEESDDDRSTLNQSDLDSQPPTPVVASSADCGTQTSWTEDGIFKIPSTPDPHYSKTGSTSDTNENIALRTRSKLSLSDTPLESIEQAFIPPDITTDMYDIDCDDEDWQNFLKEFTQPLQVVAAGNGEDDDEADPEYNILADEEINTVDKEELRADKGVKVTKKELNDLVAELFDYADLFTPPCPIDLTEENNENDVNTTNNTESQKTPEKSAETVINKPKNTLFAVEASANTPKFEVSVATTTSDSTLEGASNLIIVQSPYISHINLFNSSQKQLLEQQIRQHVQLLTQHYLQTCVHPELSFMSKTFKEMLDEINTKIEKNSKTVFNVINFQDGYKLVNDWQQSISTNDTNIKEMESFIQSEIQKFEYHFKWKKIYQSKFPPYFKLTVARNSTFLYPFLLPTKPFKPVLPKYEMKANYLPSEDELIAIGLEQFIPYAEANKIVRPGKKTVVREACQLINQYLMPSKDFNNLYIHVRRMKVLAPKNPIYYYFKYKMAPPTLHYVIPSNQIHYIPVHLQKKDNLPEPWKSYVYPEEKKIIKIPTSKSEFVSGQKLLISPVKKTRNYNKSKKSPIPKRRTPKATNILPKYIRVKPSSSLFDNPPATNIATIHIPNNLLLLNVSSTSPNKETDTSTFIMLPSMPVLSTPMKIVTESTPVVQPETTEKTKTAPEKVDNKVDGKLSEKPASKSDETVRDDDSETGELAKTNSPQVNKNKQKTSTLEKKKAKQQKEYENIVTLLSPENLKESEEKAAIYAQAYFNKVQERLTQDSPEDYNLFLATLNDHDESSDSVASLYSKVTAILSPKHPDLCEELITFLTPAQAKEIEKLIPHYMYTKMATFLRKLETYYNKQPAQIKKIYNTLSELSNQENVSMEQIKSNVLPLLKGNNFLTDYFLQIFPSEKPPESLMTVWEEIDCDSVTLNRNVEKSTECFENINIPDVADPYGSNNCICSCHNSSDEDFSSRNRHCIPCGTKFIQGKVFIQTGKGPRPANVTFPGCSFEEQSRRLSISSTLRPKRRSETASPIKNILFSPTKQSLTESEDDEHAQGKQFKHSPKNRSIKSLKSTPLSRKLNRTRHKSESRCLMDTISRNDPTQKKSINEKPSNSNDILKKSLQFRTSPKTTNKSDTETKKNSEHESELMECDDCNASVESIELKLSPERSVESLDICEESSQDLSEGNEDVPATCSESENDSIVEVESIHSESSSSDNQDNQDMMANDKSNSQLPWTREEDKIILKTFQQECDSENTFDIIGQLLPQRTVSEIRERFQTLLDLLLQITKKD